MTSSEIAAMLLRTVVRDERARADRLAAAASDDGALLPTPWAVLRQVADGEERGGHAML